MPLGCVSSNNTTVLRTGAPLVPALGYEQGARDAYLTLMTHAGVPLCGFGCACHHCCCPCPPHIGGSLQIRTFVHPDHHVQKGCLPSGGQPRGITWGPPCHIAASLCAALPPPVHIEGLGPWAHPPLVLVKHTRTGLARLERSLNRRHSVAVDAGEARPRCQTENGR
jgi:hypothetical protein